MSDKNVQYNIVFELWEIVLRYRWRFIIPTFLVCASVLCISLFLPRKYKAEAHFEKRTDMVFTEMAGRGGVTNSFQDPRATFLESIKGQPAIDQLFVKINAQLMEKGLVRNDLDRQALRSDITRQVIVHSDIATGALDRIRVEYVTTDPDLAQLVVNALVENYITNTTSAMERRLRQSSDFFQGEADRNRSVIEKLENQVLDFEIRHGELLPENPNNLQIKISEARDHLNDLIGQRDAAQMRMVTLSNALADEPRTIPSVVTARNPALVRLEEEQRNLSASLVQYKSVLKMRAKHPDMIALQQQIKANQLAISQTETEVIIERQTVTNPKRSEMEMLLTSASGEYQAVQMQVASVREQIAGYDTKAASIFEVRSGYSKLTRQVKQSQRQVTFWEDNLRRVEMARAAESGNRGVELTFIRPAVKAYKPISPNLGQVLMAAVSLGLLAGAFNVFFAHRTNESFSDGENAAKTFDLQLFGAVSEIVTAQHRRVRHLRNMVLYPTNAVVMGLVLFAFATLLYLDLEKPDVMTHLKQSAASFVLGDPSVKGTDAPMPITEE